MYAPAVQAVLRTEPVSPPAWAALLGLAFTIVLAMEIHKWTWRLRGHAA